MYLPTRPDDRPRVLLAEDDDGLRQVLLLTLRQWGYAVVDVPDGALALAVLASADAPRLAILDWQMPGLSGPEVCRRLRELGNHGTFVMVLTGRSEDEDLHVATDAGVNAVLVKPCDLEFLKGLLEGARGMVIAGRSAGAAPG